MDITALEMCQITAHIDRKAKTLLNQVGDVDAMYRDILRQALRQAGSPALEYIDQSFLYDVHEAIDSYELPAYICRRKVEELDDHDER